MAYFLKKNRKKDKLYLSIVNSYYDSERKQTVHSTYESFGTGQALIDQGISDPIAYLEDKVRTLNYEARQKVASEISDTAPYKYAGHFLVKSILSKLDVEPIFNIYDLTRSYHFKLFDVLSALIYARILKPCSKYKTYFEVIPYLESPCCFSYDQLLEGLSYFGDNYEKIVEIFSKLTNEKYGLHPSVGYFDCTNFYFEIDKEDDIRKKGPSKENRKEPLLGLGLLLDARQIPVGLKLFPGNESEKPQIRQVIDELKKQNEINGRIVQVADKGLNCARNIYEALKHHDGYLFSKSCKQLPETEKIWLLLDNGYKEIKDQNGHILYKTKECIDDFSYSFLDDSNKKIQFTITEKRVATYNPKLARKQLLEIEKDKALCGYNLLVTSEIHLSQEEIYSVYHNLWRIEESFRIMKSELDARPVYLKNKETIYGHFLICYLSTLLIRLLQIYELEDKYSYQELFKFMRNCYFTVYGKKYINMATKSEFIDMLTDKTQLPLKNAILSEKQYQKILGYKL